MTERWPNQTGLIRGLSAEEERAFDDLGIDRGTWEPLLALPLVTSTGRASGPAGAGDRLESAIFLLDSLKFVRILPRKPFKPRTTFSEKARDDALLRMIEGNGPGGDVGPTSTAMALLSWHLATDYDPTNRGKYIEVVRALPLHKSCLASYSEELESALDRLQAQVDSYLPCDRFQLEPGSGKYVGLARVDAARILLDLVLDCELPLVPPLKRPHRPRPGVPRRTTPDAFQDLLIGCLAGLPYEAREALYRALGPSTDGEVEGIGPADRPNRSPIPGPPTMVLNQLIEGIRSEVTRRRFACRAQARPSAGIAREQVPTVERTKAVPPVRGFVFLSQRDSSAPSPTAGIGPIVRSGAGPERPIIKDGPSPPSAPPAEMLPAAELPEIVDATEPGAISWSKALADARSLSVPEARRLLNQPLMFEDHLIGPDHRVIHLHDRNSLPKNLWYVGDLHSDLLALANAWDYIASQSRAAGFDPHVLFLGDFVDRGTYGHETLLYLFRLIRDNPGKIGVLPGNHDEISWDEAAGRFRSEVSSADYIDGLNAILERGVRDGSDDQDRIDLGRVACEFFERRSRAAFLPDGLLVAHGGFPHADLLERLKGRDDLGRPECLQDFLWLRASENARRKRPNRGAKGCEFGFENFSEFCRHATKDLGVTTYRLIRGHEHPPRRYATYPKYTANPIVTINTMCRRLGDESSARVEQFPWACVGRHVPDRLPEIHRLRIDEAEVRAAYFPEMTPVPPLAVEGAGSASNRLEAQL